MSHDQPTYASVPGIRVYGMMCVRPTTYQTSGWFCNNPSLFVFMFFFYTKSEKRIHVIFCTERQLQGYFFPGKIIFLMKHEKKSNTKCFGHTKHVVYCIVWLSMLKILPATVLQPHITVKIRPVQTHLQKQFLWFRRTFKIYKRVLHYFVVCHTIYAV